MYMYIALPPGTYPSLERGSGKVCANFTESIYMYNIPHVFIHTCNTVATGNSISSHEHHASESLLNDLNKTLIITMLWVGCKRSLNLHVTTRLSVENNHLLN